ncbi:uncharacterized protein LOC120770719 [Bactrocera tryoni]|uniref:uncharacterized protein LOC120770719 n=1 Tax=Bactrocera tryoni TaxID=59916 RepID=UPI001A970431|nr:uncharacterized protein LOC120770719 [Bactrocera tryoni]
MPKKSFREKLTDALIDEAAEEIMDIEEIESDDDAVDAVIDELADNISVVMECRRGVCSTIPKSDIWRNNILTTLDEDRFRQMLRVDRDQYNMLVHLIKNDDARIYRNSSLFQQNEQYFSSLQWIAGDSAYPLSGTLITPYRSNARQLDRNGRIAFNLRHIQDKHEKDNALNDRRL